MLFALLWKKVLSRINNSTTSLKFVYNQSFPHKALLPKPHPASRSSVQHMAKKALALAALLVIAVALAAAPVPAHAVCNMSNDQFMKCQPAAAATTNPTPDPSTDCCTVLKDADLACLCSYKNSPWLSLYNIDPKRAMELPAKCGLTPPADC